MHSTSDHHAKQKSHFTLWVKLYACYSQELRDEAGVLFTLTHFTNLSQEAPNPCLPKPNTNILPSISEPFSNVSLKQSRLQPQNKQHVYFHSSTQCLRQPSYRSINPETHLELQLPTKTRRLAEHAVS